MTRGIESPHHPDGRGPSYREVQAGDEFVQLRRRFRRFVFPLTGAFLSWYFLYVVLAAFAPAFMGTEVVGSINIGLLFGLGQFVSTFAITTIYVHWANRHLDPTADRLRSQLEAGTGTGTGARTGTGTGAGTGTGGVAGATGSARPATAPVQAERSADR